ncbi:transcription termination factor NusA [Williamsoniiplasma lucivorax]|uniref:Transcription termination/antitermination protein NusA n=1 Tax=Williamsoniiplasma lucivorax TaxID=209274 RepID=A0A2S5RDU4_9MOLU|nr:transcription termination factor NusA [Williamsoniiplasma lucivorax]PPE05496.1 transcription elongation factor NusA [Williamsoniiplasma lucivorax]
MINGAVLLAAINEIATEKKIEKEVVLQGIKEGFKKAYERFFDTEANVDVQIDEQAGTLKMFQLLEVVQKVEDDWLEISLEDAHKINKDFKIGDIVKKEVHFGEEFSRLAVIQVRQILQQKIKGAERANVYSKFIDLEHTISPAKVTGMNEQGNSYLLDINGAQASLWKQKVIPGEKFEVNQIIDVYIEEVAKEDKFSQIKVSRTTPAFLEKLLVREVPEIRNGLIEIKAISREPGVRAKVAVMSHDQAIDPKGSIIGENSARIDAVRKALKDERIDIIKWDEDLTRFIIETMAPVRVISINFVEGTEEIDIVVPNEQLSLAIGKKGVAARLVANLIRKRINIYSYDDAQQFSIDINWNGNITLTELTSPEFIESTMRRRQPMANKPFTRYQDQPRNNNFRNNEYRNNNYKNNDNSLNSFQNNYNLINEDELLALQEEIKEIQAIDQLSKQEDDFEENIDFATPTLELDEIRENIEAFNNLEEDENVIDDEDDEDFEDESYDKYYN